MIRRNMNIRVIEIRPLNDGRPLKAFISIQVGDWVIHDFRIVQRSGERVSVLPPQVSWKDPQTGRIKYKGILTIPPEQKQRIDVMILSAYQKEMEKIHGSQS
jgi:hypothetical protein